MGIEKAASYVGSAIAIAGGFGVLYFPPPLMGAGAGTVAFATTLIVGGLAALGVTVAVPRAVDNARRAALAERPRSAKKG